jgi:hypothetical protein
MKDGEVWVVEYKVKGKWQTIASFYRKKIALESIKFHFCAINDDKKNYRVAKYIREDKP